MPVEHVLRPISPRPQNSISRRRLNSSRSDVVRGFSHEAPNAILVIIRILSEGLKWQMLADPTIIPKTSCHRGIVTANATTNKSQTHNQRRLECTILLLESVNANQERNSRQDSRDPLVCKYQLIRLRGLIYT